MSFEDKTLNSPTLGEPEENWGSSDESLVDLRCSVAVLRRQAVLLIHRSEGRGGDGDWVLPGGRPRLHEGVAACARREVAEETGLSVDIGPCLFVFEVISAPPAVHRGVEIVFAGSLNGKAEPSSTEPFHHVQFVSLDRLGSLTLRPPIAGHLRGLARRTHRDGAAYLGNLWRPDGIRMD